MPPLTTQNFCVLLEKCRGLDPRIRSGESKDPQPIGCQNLTANGSKAKEKNAILNNQFFSFNRYNCQCLQCLAA